MALRIENRAEIKIQISKRKKICRKKTLFLNTTGNEISVTNFKIRRKKKKVEKN